MGGGWIGSGRAYLLFTGTYPTKETSTLVVVLDDLYNKFNAYATRVRIFIRKIASKDNIEFYEYKGVLK